MMNVQRFLRTADSAAIISLQDALSDALPVSCLQVFIVRKSPQLIDRLGPYHFKKKLVSAHRTEEPITRKVVGDRYPVSRNATVKQPEDRSQQKTVPRIGQDIIVLENQTDEP
jgi:hypothetical protein